MPNMRPGPSGNEVMKMHAVSRIMLNGYINNIQVSWVKEGARMSQLLLGAGANDFGGTLMNESISTAAGAQYGQLNETQVFTFDNKRSGQSTGTAHDALYIDQVIRP